jgi:hypothetical protein
MSLLKKLGLIAEDENAIVPSKVKEGVAATPLKMESVQTPVYADTPEVVNIVKIIQDTVTQANLEGPDFFEFMNALEKPTLQSLTEDNRYASVFEIMGISKDKLIATSQAYIDALDSEEQRFEEQLAISKKTKVDDVQLEIDRLSAENIQMQQKIQSNIASITTLTQQKNEASVKINNVASAHGVNIDRMKEKITTIVSNIQKYIK